MEEKMKANSKYYRIGPISRAYKQATLFFWEGNFRDGNDTRIKFKGESFETVFDSLVEAINNLKEKGYTPEVKS
jgi:hypothetical protein